MFKSILFFQGVLGCLVVCSAVLASAEAPIGDATKEIDTRFASAGASCEFGEHRLEIFLKGMTDAATKTRINADFVPGMVTVLHGKDLEARGAGTLAEALRTAPGMDIYYDGVGAWKTRVRGLDDQFSHGNFNILLDGIPMDNAFRFNPALETPIELIERIDIVRGPASAIYGEFALSGVVDVITRKTGLHPMKRNRVFARFDSHDRFAGGGVLSTSNESGSFEMSLNASINKAEDSGVQSGPDRFAAEGFPSYAPGPVNDRRELETVFFNLRYMDFSFRAQLLNHGQGDFFGCAMAPPPYENRIVFRNRFLGGEASQRVHLRDRLNAEFKLGWRKQRLKADDAWLWTMPGSDMTFGAHSEESAFRAGVELRWSGNAVAKDGQPRHNVLFGWSMADVRLENIWFETGFAPVSYSFTPVTPSEGGMSGLEDDVGRCINSFTIQDEYHAFDRLAITAGFRWDRYDDLGDHVSPRLAAVYHASRRHIFKAQIARAFRPPTLGEIHIGNNSTVFGDAELESERNDAFEIGYIYRSDPTLARATLFYSEVKDVIGVMEKERANGGSVRLKGVELELERQLIMNTLKLDANISYVNSEHSFTDADLPCVADWLANVGLVYRPFNYLTFALQYRHVGNRHRDADDPRDDGSSCNTFDFTGTMMNIMLKGLTVRCGIKNIFDEDVRYPSPAPIRSGIVKPTWPEDFPRPGRSWWVQISHDF